MSELKYSMFGTGMFSQKDGDNNFLKSDSILKYIFIVLLIRFLSFFLPGAGFVSRGNSPICRRPKKSKDIRLSVPSIGVIEKSGVNNVCEDASYNLRSGPLCGIARNSLLFLLKSVSSEKYLWKSRRFWCCVVLMVIAESMFESSRR